MIMNENQCDKLQRLEESLELMHTQVVSRYIKFKHNAQLPPLQSNSEKVETRRGFFGLIRSFFTFSK